MTAVEPATAPPAPADKRKALRAIPRGIWVCLWISEITLGAMPLSAFFYRLDAFRVRVET